MTPRRYPLFPDGSTARHSLHSLCDYLARHRCEAHGNEVICHMRIREILLWWLAIGQLDAGVQLAALRLL